jgi:DNA processing protein
MRLLPLTEDERQDWLRLSLSENVGPITFQALLQRCGSASEAIRQLPDLSRRGGSRRPLRLYPELSASRDLERAQQIGARFVALCEPDYPPLLREIDAPPPLICIKGSSELARRSVVGIVGARNASAIGRRLARQIAQAAGRAGFPVASGLARGIDTAAHEAALETGTIAVVAGGLDVIYPSENAALQAAIAESGLLVSEMVPGTIPRESHFPRRNRIISGLSRAVVIVEAALRSGSLITARYASEQGREVFAVPGSPLDPRAEGCNRLIRDGANLLLSSMDVIDVLSAQSVTSRSVEPLPQIAIETGNDTRDQISNLLSPTPIDVDDLIRESGFAPAMVHALLLELELAGRVRRHPRGAVSLA